MSMICYRVIRLLCAIVAAFSLFSATFGSLLACERCGRESCSASQGKCVADKSQGAQQRDGADGEKESELDAMAPVISPEDAEAMGRELAIAERAPVNPFAQTGRFAGLRAAPNMIGDFFGGGGGAGYLRSFNYNDLLLDGAEPILYRYSPFLVVAEYDTPVTSGPYDTIDPNSMEAYNDAAGGVGPGGVTPWFTTANPDVPAGGTLVTQRTTERDIGTNPSYPEYRYDTTFVVAYGTIAPPSPGNGGVVGRTKIAENTSPLPRDRLLFNYSYFDNVPLIARGVNVHRFTPGIEKTFFDGMTSLELKVPMAATLDSTITQDGTTNLSSGQIGDLAVTGKVLLLEASTTAISVGLTVGLPTASDINLVLSDGTKLIEIDNQSVGLAPFLGWLWTPTDRLFAQAFLQYEFDASGSPVYVNRSLQGLEDAGTLTGTTFQYFDVGLGYWSHRDSSPCAFLQGIAWTGELHWNKSLQGSDVVRSGNFVVGNLGNNIEVINLTLGAHVCLKNATTVTCGYAAPLGGGSDQQFDGEFRLMVNKYFGPAARSTQTPTL